MLMVVRQQALATIEIRRAAAVVVLKWASRALLMASMGSIDGLAGFLFVVD
jgi:hypothetical protein